MQIFIIPLIALGASCLTFFSGFGLTTLMLPGLLLFFPVETAIALAAVIHLLNNVFKFLILRQNVNWPIAIKFGMPAFICAFFGAKLLLVFEGIPAICTYQIFNIQAEMSFIKLVMGFVIMLFVLVDIVPWIKNIKISEKMLPLGGVFSGFFGGLSGHQGALRTMFLIKCGLSKEMFIATGVIIATAVDISRLSVYWDRLKESNYQEHLLLMVLAVIFALIGVVVGRKLLHRVTIKTVKAIVSIFLFIIAVLLGAGII